MGAQHTPAPWFDGRSERFPETYIRGANDRHIAVVAWSGPESDADAKLIAAARALLAALHEIIAINDEDQGTFRKRGGTRRGLSIVAAREAINKAIGEQP